MGTLSKIFAAILCALSFALPSAAHAGNWVRGSVLTYSSFSAASTTSSVTIWTVPGDGYYIIHNVVLERMVDFAGRDDAGPHTTATAEIGLTSGDSDQLVDPVDVFTGAKATARYSLGSSTSADLPDGNIYAAGTAIKCLLTASGKTNTLTAGKLTAWFYVSRLPSSGY